MKITCQVLKQVAVEHQLAEDDVLGAFVRTLDWLKPVLADYLIQSYGYWEPDDLEDVVAQTIAIIMEAIQEGQVIRSIVGFARIVARAQAAQLVITEERQKRITTALAEYQPGGTCSQSAEELVIADEEAAEYNRRLQIMRQVIAEIEDETTQKLLAMRLRGMLLKEIAPLLGLSLSATRARYWRVQQKIRESILSNEAELPAMLPWSAPIELGLGTQQEESKVYKRKTAA